MQRRSLPRTWGRIGGGVDEGSGQGGASMTEVVRSLGLFTPEIALTAGLMLVVLVDAFGASWRNAVGRLLTMATLALALVLALRLLPAGSRGASIFSGMVVVDPLGLFFKVFLLAASLLTVLLFTFRNSR